MGGFSVASIVVWGKGWECSVPQMPVTQSYASCTFAEVSRGSWRVGSGCGAQSPWKRKAHNCFCDEMLRKPSSLALLA